MNEYLRAALFVGLLAFCWKLTTEYDNAFPVIVVLVTVGLALILGHC